MNAHVDLQIIRLPEDGTTTLAPDAGQPAAGYPLAFFAAVKIGVRNRRLIFRLGGGGGGTGVNASLVSLQLADTLEALAADGAGVHDAWRVALYALLSIFPFLHLLCRSSYVHINFYICFPALQGRKSSCIGIAKPYLDGNRLSNSNSKYTLVL